MTVICPECEGLEVGCQLCDGHGTLSDPSPLPGPDTDRKGVPVSGPAEPIDFGWFTLPTGQRTLITWDPRDGYVRATLPNGGQWWLAHIDSETVVRSVLAGAPHDAPLIWATDRIQPWDGTGPADPYAWTR